MPGIGGLEAAALLRSAGCALPIITLSAHAPQQIAEQARRHGCDASLAKPVDPDELSLRIQRVLSCTELPRTG